MSPTRMGVVVPDHGGEGGENDIIVVDTGLRKFTLAEGLEGIFRVALTNHQGHAL